MQPDLADARETSAHFEAAAGGPRFVLTHRPRRTAERGTVVLAPPFAEEMNKCRRMLARTARALAADGWCVVQVDLYGCGDSAGEFEDATWEQWVADLAQAVDTHARTNGGLWLWGVRAGALLLPPLLRAHPHAHVLLWQPAHDGATILNQFLRLHTSAALLDGGSPGNRAGLHQQLARGEPVEVAGYVLPSRVADGLAAARLELPAQSVGRIVWLEVAAQADDTMPAAARRTLDTWRAAGRAVEFETVVGPQFWQTVEIAEAPELIERTRSALARPRASVGAESEGAGA